MKQNPKHFKNDPKRMQERLNREQKAEEAKGNQAMKLQL